MSVHLVGGGWTSVHAPTVYGPFLAEAAMLARARGRSIPQIVVLAVGEDISDGRRTWQSSRRPSVLPAG